MGAALRGCARGWDVALQNTTWGVQLMVNRRKECTARRCWASALRWPRTCLAGRSSAKCARSAMFMHGCNTIQRLVCATFHRSALSRCAGGATECWLAPFRTETLIIDPTMTHTLLTHYRESLDG